MLNLRKSEEDADVSFTVRGKTYLAHNNIIKANAPILAKVVAIASLVSTRSVLPRLLKISRRMHSSYF
jgi:hypothetical protein